MCDALRELMKDDLEDARKQGESEGEVRGKAMGEVVGEAKIILKMNNSGMTPENIVRFLEKSVSGFLENRK